ncbi:MAG: Acetylornithine aminotransferase [Actinomycetota bacterium]|jgi:acetylornithine aminotransferase
MSKQWSDVILGNYGTPSIELVSGEGCYVTDSNGRKYLDLLAGIAVSSLGHSHPALVEAVSNQVATLTHTSNLYANPRARELAEKLLNLADMNGKVFFSQDGATANEAALKLARIWGRANGRTKFISMTNSFHGRTMGALSVTGNPLKREPFAPFGFDVEFVEYGDIQALQRACNSSVAAVIVEPIQGEGGVVVPSATFLSDVRFITRAAGSIMIVDEVQSGIGRTGEWFASSPVKPDIITLAKGLAGGMPLGAMLVDEKYANVFSPGDHGTTFGGNPVSCAAALAVIETVESEDLLRNVRDLSSWFQAAMKETWVPDLIEVRGAGLWFGLVFESHSAQVIEAEARMDGFLINAVKSNVIRIAPPLNISKRELQMFVGALPDIVKRAIWAI